MSTGFTKETSQVAAARPLVVDLDCTLLQSDILVESFFSLVSASPLHALQALAQIRHGRAALKLAIARHATLDLTTLPFNAEVLIWLKSEKDKGRCIYLASASDENYVQSIADYIGLFDGIFASNGATNLKGKAKADVLCKTFGVKGFDYAGNEKVDLAIWEQAGSVIIVNANQKLQRDVQKRFPAAKIFLPQRVSLKDYGRVLRTHQWLKNLLVFVPAFTAHHFDLDSALGCLLAFVSFSFCASSVYILNDLLDLKHDRQHHSKRYRPLAAGVVNIRHGLMLLVATLVASLAFSSFLPWQFFLVLCSYYVLTFCYSAFLKRQMMLDVVTLALLYSMRLMAGAAAVMVSLSPWLLSFSVFLFLSLALIKRCAELTAKQSLGGDDPAGRGYRLADLPVLQSMAAAAGYVAALTSGLYISSPNVTQLYSNPEMLWAIPVILLFWISRILVLTHRGEMHDDPVFFAVRDRISLVCGVCMLIVVILSI